MTARTATLDSRKSSPALTFHRFQPGDLVTPQGGYPILYEVLTIEREDTLRVRGMNWAAGYSALVHIHEVRPVTKSLAD
jgi:hypothetical protein